MSHIILDKSKRGWWKSAVFYQIYPKSFQDTNGDGIGDLRGIINKLEYIRDLGINGIYMLPLFLSNSNHKYNTFDYDTIDPDFGTEEDMIELVEKAHDRGMKIVLDAVFNHCSMQMRQFEDVLEKGVESRFYQWFCIDGDYPDPKECNYECFAACNYIPKLNTANEEVQELSMMDADELEWVVAHDQRPKKSENEKSLEEKVV